MSCSAAQLTRVACAELLFSNNLMLLLLLLISQKVTVDVQPDKGRLQVHRQRLVKRTGGGG